MKHHNTNILQKISDTFKPKGEMLPEYVDEGITLIYDVEPDCNVILDATATDATSATIYTTPADRDFFIKAVYLTTSRSAGATSLNSTITCVVGGTTKTLCRLNTLTTTAGQALYTYLPLPKPLKVDRGSIIAVTNSTNVTLITTTGIIYGYLVD